MAVKSTASGMLGRLRQFAADARAVAAVEFALILPPLLVLYAGSIEASSLITVDRRVQIISGTMGDLVARWDPEAGAVTMSTLTDYFAAAESILHPYDDTALKQVISVVRVFDDDTTSVVWSCGYNGGVKRTTGTAYALDAHLRELVKGASDYVVASETTYSYTPVLGIELGDVYDLGAESFYLPRYEQVVNGPAC
jgi:Flp pilus assembly protein TadG